MSEVAHKRRRLEVKQRKWTKEEISTILDYIEETADFECPTAQAYYKKLLEKYAINATWDLVRFKVRHLRLKLKKAMEVLRAERACLSESDDCFDLARKIYKICPEYSRLLKLFASKTATEDDMLPELSTLDGSMCMLLNDDDTLMMEDTGDEEYETVKSEEYADPLRENQVGITKETIYVSVKSDNTKVQTKNNERTLHKTNATLGQSNHSKVMGNDISKSYFVPGRSAELQKLQFEFEKEKYQKQLELKERRLQLEEDKHNTEKEYKNRLLEIKLFQIERDERLKTLELERDERLRKLELEKDERIRKLELQRDERLEMSKIENMRVT